MRFGPCGACTAKDSEIAFLRGRVEELERQVAEIAGYRAITTKPPAAGLPARARHGPSKQPLVPWAQSLIGDDHAALPAPPRISERARPAGPTDEPPAS